jgi:hypothetical protein
MTTLEPSHSDSPPPRLLNPPRRSSRGLARFVLPIFLAGAVVATAAAAPTVSFTSPADGHLVIALTGCGGTVQEDAAPIQEVVFSIYNSSTGQWWSGSNYQGGFVWLAAAVSGTNWTPAPGVELPALCCGQAFQLAAQVTDTATNIGTATIAVITDGAAPLPGFAPLADGQIVTNLAAIGGSVTDDFNAVASVTFSIHELDINYGAGRWWNGTNFQNTPVDLPAVISGTDWFPAPTVALPPLNSGQTYALTVTASDTTSNTASVSINVTCTMTELGWDSGATPLGTVVLPNPNANGGNYWFKIVPHNPSVGVWRTALNVSGGEADVYLSHGWQPTIYNHQVGSQRIGSDGFVLDAAQFNPGEDWYVLVHATPEAGWNLVSGDAYVYNLGPLAADDSGGTNAAIGAEGTIFYRTTISADTLAWRLWLNGATNTVYVKKSAAPTTVAYDLIQARQMLVVPPYLAGGTFNGSYFISVPGDPGTVIAFDSRKHVVTDLPFASLTGIVVDTNDFPYRTFRVQVPVQQIAWQLNLVPAAGLPNIAVRRDVVPNEFHNDAFSETPTNVGASVTLVPPPPTAGPGSPGLSDGTFFVTVYSTGAFACAFTNSNPVITDVHYLFSITNDTPNRAGWRYYRVGNILEQLGTLGWDLLLANQVPGTEIALRRNAVPGAWNQRLYDNTYYSQAQGYADDAGTGGFLQRPGHQADIWYIGIYTPDQALGNFVLTGQQLTGQFVGFDSGGSASVADQPAGKWKFFRIDIPLDAAGWDVRLTDVTNGNPHMVVCRDTLPHSVDTDPWWWGPNATTGWPGGYQWAAGADWTGCGGGPMLAMGIGNPLQAGTYYVGVRDPNGASSYTLQSRGIGTNYTIQIRDLDFNGTATNTALMVSEGDYYRVVVPDNAPDWKLHLKAVEGDVVLKVQQDFLPNSGYGGTWWWPYGGVQSGFGGQLMSKAGDEQWTLLPVNGQSNVTPGTYYVLVGSQGQNLVNNCEGSGTASYELSSGQEPVTVLPDELSYGNDLVVTNAQSSGELKFYQFNVPDGIASIEVRLEDRAGNPQMNLVSGTALVGAMFAYGNYGGVSPQWSDGGFITVVNPSGPFSLTVFANPDADASYVLRVHAAPPPPVAFDGGTYSVADQPAGNWRFFRIDVPADAVGWDLRLVDVTNGNPQMVVCRDLLPHGLYTDPWWWGPNLTTIWPGGYQWVGGADWTGCGGGPMLAMGMGNPLQPGTYYIGVRDPNYSSSYTLQSRGIGTNYTIHIHDLDFNGTATNSALVVSEGDYYRVAVPDNAPDWKLHLKAVDGDVVLKVQQDFLPNSGYGGTWLWPYGGVQSGSGGQWMSKAGDEQWALLPVNGQSNVTAGTYYVLVGSQGQNLVNNCDGSGTASYELSSGEEPVTVLPDELSYGNDLVLSCAQLGGEFKFYRFNVPPGIPTIEVRLENRVGNPLMLLNNSTALAGAPYIYGNFGGVNPQWTDGSLITIANPAPGSYSLTVFASGAGNDFPDANFVLRVRAPAIPELSFSSELNTNEVTNVVTGLLADNQRAFYRVTVPDEVAGAPVLGWNLNLADLNGSPSVRVRKDYLPDTACDTTAFANGSTIIAPPYLSPGTWYVEVRGGGATDFTLSSAVITTNSLQHPLWVMPALNESPATPGLSAPMVGDSGVEADGNPLPGDQGIDLAEGHYDFYAVEVPTNNAGLLRTELQAISGNPNLYIRVGAAPTFNHYAQGQCDWWDGQLIDRQLTGNTTEYANWVPLHGRYETQLTPGLWIFAVQAAGTANARYRLQLSCGNPQPNTLVQNLALDGGSVTNQNLNGGDWRYYRVEIPSNAPTQWFVTFNRNLGGARMFVRDTVPPGDGNLTADYSSSGYNPEPWWWWLHDLENWSRDGKNQGPYPRFDAPGTYTLSVPPLRPASAYYLGIWSPNDTTFSLSSSIGSETIDVSNMLAFYDGAIDRVIPAHGAVRYRMEVPSEATRIVFNNSNSPNVLISLEQGTVALPGGPAHWTGSGVVSINQSLTVPNNWPWLPGRTYYLTATNASDSDEMFAFEMTPPADLVPSAVSAPASITTARPNPQVEIAWTVTNQGLGIAPAPWWDHVWLSTNGVLDSHSVPIADFYSGQSLAPGDSYRVTNTVSLQLDHNANYTVFVQSDIYDSVYESNEVNNVSEGASGTFALVPPDLAPVTVVIPPSLVAMQTDPTITVAWAVTNRGAGAATGSWYDRVWFSTNGVLDSQSVVLGDYYWGPTIPSGESYWQTNVVTLPISASGDNTYTIFIETDVYHWLFESDESNNISDPANGLLTLHLRPYFTQEPDSQSVVPGATVSFTAAVAGSPPISLQWFSNSIVVPDGTNTSLVLSNVSSGAAEFFAIATNLYGSATSSIATLTLFSSNCIAAPPGLMAWWPAESNTLDPIGGNNGLLVNGATFAPGFAGQAFSLSGGGDYVEITNSDAFNFGPTAPMSVELWVYRTGNSPVMHLLGKRNGCGDIHYQMAFDYSGLAFGSYYGSVSTGWQMPLNTWIHLAATFDGSTFRFYTNGVLAATGSGTLGPPTSTPLRLGASGDCGATFAGLLDEVAIYNRALAADEIASIYAAGPNGKCPVPVEPLRFGMSPASLLWTSNGMQLGLDGSAGHGPIILYASTNLTFWTPIFTNPPVTGELKFLDPDATNFPLRFYRAEGK